MADAPGAGQEKLPDLGAREYGAEKPSATSSSGISPQADVNEQLPDLGASKTAEPSQAAPRSSPNPSARSPILSKSQTQPKASGSTRPSSGKSTSSKQTTLVCAPGSAPQIRPPTSATKLASTSKGDESVAVGSGDDSRAVTLHTYAAATRATVGTALKTGRVLTRTLSGKSLGSAEPYAVAWNAAGEQDVSTRAGKKLKLGPKAVSDMTQQAISLMARADEVNEVN